MPAPTPETTVPASARAEVEEIELAFARLDWVRCSSCLDLPAQREALQWHVACCAAATEAVERRPDGSSPA